MYEGLSEQRLSEKLERNQRKQKRLGEILKHLKECERLDSGEDAPMEMEWLEDARSCEKLLLKEERELMEAIEDISREERKGIIDDDWT